MAKRKPGGEPALPATKHGPIAPGDWVSVSQMAGTGRVESLDTRRGRARVLLGDHILAVSIDQLAHAPAPPEASKSNLVRVVGSAPMQYQADLHGMRVEDALEAVDRALDQAVVNHLEKFKIIHGHGTGALRKAIRDLLARHPHVESYRFGEPHEGGLACTVAFLKPLKR